MTDEQTAPSANEEEHLVEEQAAARYLKRALIAWPTVLVLILIFRWFPDIWNPLRTALAFAALISGLVALSSTFSWHEHRSNAQSFRPTRK